MSIDENDFYKHFTYVLRNFITKCYYYASHPTFVGANSGTCKDIVWVPSTTSLCCNICIYIHRAKICSPL
jgi:hypothetical protein